MNYIYFELETSGASPLYSRINGISSVAFFDGSFRTFQRNIGSLPEESSALTEFSIFADGISVIACPNKTALSFITSCYQQYCLPEPFSAMSLFEPSPDEIIDSFGKKRFHQLISEVCIEAELKHFFNDYKNYYYLPAEDIAVHKSVSQFVDRAARVQATAQTAYTKKAGNFIPASPYSDRPLFKICCNDPAVYIPASDPDAATCLHLISHIPQDV